MPRSLKKGPFVDDHLQKKVDVQMKYTSVRMLDLATEEPAHSCCGSWCPSKNVQDICFDSSVRVVRKWAWMYGLHCHSYRFDRLMQNDLFY